MKKLTVICVCILLVCIGIGAWQFGYVKKASDQLNKATLVTRVEKLIGDQQNAIAQTNKDRKEVQIKTAVASKQLERLQSEYDQTTSAMQKLADAVKEAGLPKPSEMATLNDEQKAKKWQFGDKETTTANIYSTLNDWNKELKTLKSKIEAAQRNIDALNSLVEKFGAKKNEQEKALLALNSNLQELKTSKELKEVTSELADLQSYIAADDNSGAIAKVIGEMQGVIDVNVGETGVDQKRIAESETTLTPTDVLAPSNENEELNKLWE